MNTKRKISALLGIVLIILAGTVIYFNYFKNKNYLNSEKENTMTSYKEATYILEDEQIKLGTNAKYFGNQVETDFNNDGFQDIAFILTSRTIGSGTFYYVALALGKDGGYEGANTIFLGDRIAPQTTEYKDGQIIVNYADRNPTEPMTAKPSVGVSKYFEVQDNKLVSVKSVTETPKPIITLCTKEQRSADFCAQVYAPVCAEVQIQCIKAPCNPIKETFSSSCEACKNQLVSSYTAGECKK